MGEKKVRIVEMSNKNKEEKGEKEEKKEEIKTQTLKEDVTVWFLWKPLKFLSRVRSGELW